LKEVVSEFTDSATITGGLTCDTINLPTIGDVETSIQGKQATITSATDLTSNSLTTGNIVSPKFRVVKLVENLTNIIPTSGTDNTQELVSFTTFGGTLKFDFDFVGSSSSNNTALTYIIFWC